MKTYETNQDFLRAFFETSSRPFIGEEFSIPITCVNDIHGEYIDIVFSDELGCKVTLDKKFTQALEGFLYILISEFKEFSLCVVGRNSVEVRLKSLKISFHRTPVVGDNDFLDGVRFITHKGNFSFLILEKSLSSLWEILYCLRI